jgi:hypothetical protein
MNDSDYLQHIGEQDRYIEELVQEADALRERLRDMSALLEKKNLLEDELNARIKELEEEIVRMKEFRRRENEK